MNPLLLPYLANIVILVPVVLGALFNLFPLAGRHFPESAGWRTITGSLWCSILIGSVLGLYQPVLFSPLLLLQVIYKSLWLVIYVMPRLLRREKLEEIHWGIAITFALIIALYPLVIPWAYLFGGN